MRNWGGDANERRSTTGYVFFVGVGAISWNCMREPTCRAPKFLVDPLEGPSMRQCGRSWNLEHDPDFQH
jgi:hypothetical protein